MNSVKKAVFSVTLLNSFTAKILVRQKSVYTKFSEVLTNNLTLVKSSSQQQNGQEKPVVIMYGWLMARNKYINRYSDIYIDRGFDVLQVKISPKQVLWPLSVTSTVDSVIDFMTSHPAKSVLVHGFSVGGFVHTEVMYKLFESEKAIHKEAIKLVKGQIFDSVVDIVGIEEGISTALFFNIPVLKKLTKMSISSYLNATKKSVGAIYERDAEFFHSNPLKIPSLMLHSKMDNIGCVGPIEKAIKTWRMKGILVDDKCWDDSLHVSHFKKYPDEYVQMIDNFLLKIGLAASLKNEAANVVFKSSFSTPPPTSLPHSLRVPSLSTSSSSSSSSPIPQSRSLNNEYDDVSLRKDKARVAVKNN